MLSDEIFDLVAVVFDDVICSTYCIAKRFIVQHMNGECFDKFQTIATDNDTMGVACLAITQKYNS